MNYAGGMQGIKQIKSQGAKELLNRQLIIFHGILMTAQVVVQ